MKHSILSIFLVILSGFCYYKKPKPFSAIYLNQITVTGFYEEDLPEYVINLKCKINGQLFYADTLNEFEFQNCIWPTAKQIGKDKYQLLLELSDRPDKDKIVLLTIAGNKLLAKQTIPTFDSSYRTANGIQEFSGELEYAEAMNNPHKTQYIPTLFYADKTTGFELDTAKTIAFNKSKWGKFYGFKPDFKLILTPNTIK
jgi:hypothetical protein